MPLWGCKKNGAESGRQHGAEARFIAGWLATDPFSGVAGLLNRWAALVLWEALDEKVTPLLVEDAVESVKLRGAKLELKAAGQVGWLFLSALRMVYWKTKLRDEVAALQERQLLMKETIESAEALGDQMEARVMEWDANKMVLRGGVCMATMVGIRQASVYGDAAGGDVGSTRKSADS
ncbi:hypothetical protein NDU88_000458 [Pleurodeles waltl]|uniref:Uncharacterized protein n=1 Tax=Pleurodeles waltl TaxID=8319 RepID=A0AAV7S661_PLEWA|nr:hypothetical protein NDU88_000458 [Pleurodeles waltl]